MEQSPHPITTTEEEKTEKEPSQTDAKSSEKEANKETNLETKDSDVHYSLQKIR